MGLHYVIAGYRKMATMLCILICPALLVAQQSPSRIFQKADSLRHLARLDSSTVLFQQAASLFEQHQEWNQQVHTLYKISQNKTEQGQLDEAASYLDKAYSLSKSKKLGSDSLTIRYYYQKGLINEQRADYKVALNNFKQGLALAQKAEENVLQVKLMVSIGDVYISQGNYQKAVDQFSSAQELYFRTSLTEKALLSSIYNSYGIAYKNSGDQNRALSYFQKSLEIDRQILPPQHPSLAKTNNNIAIFYYYQGDYQRSLEYFKNAVNVLATFYGETHRLVAAGYNNIGIVYSEMGKLANATDYLEKALQIREKILGKDHPDMAIGYQNLGAIYYDMEKYDQAIRYYKRSEAIHLKQFPDGHPELANVYANLGQAFAAKEEYKKALEYYQKDLDINLTLVGGEHPFIGDTYTKIGKTYAMVDNYDRALNYYEKALDVFIQDYSPEHSYQNLSFDEVAYPYLLLETLKLKGKTLKNYAKETGRQDLLEQSLQAHLQAVSLIDNIQQSHNRKESKLLLRERTVDVYKRGFEVAYALQQKTSDERYKEYAFFFVEKSKNQILLEQIRRLNARDIAQIPDSLIDKEQALHIRLTDLQSRISSLATNPQPSDSLKRIALQDSLFHARQQLQKHINRLETSYPKYYELKYEPVLTKASTIQQQILSDNQAMISYFFGDESVFALVLKKETFDIRKLPTDSLLQQDIRSYRDTILERSSPATFAQSSHQLYNQLIQPLHDLIRGDNLLIIPDGMLHYLPFESLVTQPLTDANPARFHKLAYLLQEHTINYAPSAGYLELSNQTAKGNSPKQFVGFAPGFSDLSASMAKRDLYPDYERPLTSLPLSKKEVKEVGNLFESQGFWSFLTSGDNKSDVYLGDSASEQTFKSLPLQNHRYIHLATHAYVSEAHPEKSGILFSAPQASEEDGTLHAAEIYNLQLNAHLVTLSACKTGIGTVAEGEGMMSLSRAFQYAGAENLLVSLWSVSDRTTARLMLDFYKQTHNNTKMPQALRQAKLAMIDNGQYAHPKYWAPFIFIGQ